MHFKTDLKYTQVKYLLTYYCQKLKISIKNERFLFRNSVQNNTRVA